MADIFRNAYLKIKRANRHIDEVIADSASLPEDLYEFTNGPARSVAILAEPDCFDLAYRPKQPVGEHFGAIIGDAVNNLREALEYFANTAISAVGQRRKVYFPFSDEWENFETSPNYPAIHKAFPDLAHFIRDHIKPCRDTNLDLWAATSLCNFNKHNDFVPTVIVAEVKNINSAVGRNGGLKNNTVRWHANNPMILARSPAPITVEKQLGLAVEVVFPKGAVFEDQPVVPTLANMSKVVKKTLDALVRFTTPRLK